MENLSEIRRAMRFGAPSAYVVQEYLSHGDPLCPDLCGRTFALYLGNGYVDPAMNTAAGAQDVKTCEKFLRGYCYRQFHGGQMEQVLEDLVCVSYIRTPAEVLNVIRELRKFGIIGAIHLFAEYAQGYPVSIKTY